MGKKNKQKKPHTTTANREDARRRRLENTSTFHVSPRPEHTGALPLSLIGTSSRFIAELTLLSFHSGRTESPASTRTGSERKILRRTETSNSPLKYLDYIQYSATPPSLLLASY